MTKKEVILGIPKGIHLRVAGAIAKKANDFESEIFIEHNNMEVNCKSVMGVAVLGAMQGDNLVISANGPDENKALLTLAYFLENEEDNKSENEIFNNYIVGASWMNASGDVYLVRGFHQEWVDKNKNSALLGDVNTVNEVIEKLNWINVMLYKDKTVEFHVADLSDSVLERIRNFLNKLDSDWVSAHIFTSQKESIYVKVDKELFFENNGDIKKLVDEKLVMTQHY